MLLRQLSESVKKRSKKNRSEFKWRKEPVVSTALEHGFGTDAPVPASTLLAVRGETPRLVNEGIRRAKGMGESARLYVRPGRPGLFDGHTSNRF